MHSSKRSIPLTKKTTLAAVLALSLCSAHGVTWADGSGTITIAPLKPDVPYVFVIHQGRTIKVQRDVYKSFIARSDIRGPLIQTSPSCPPFCLQKMELDVPVVTIGEAEIVDFMLTTLRDKKGILVDVRTERTYKNSTIPGSVNYPLRRINKGADSKEFITMLEELGAKHREKPDWLTQQMENIGLIDASMLSENWDFSDAKDLILWSSSATDNSAATSIKALLTAGYPAQKLKWYRGGMAAWQYWGFTTVKRR
jgi:rhodanese-related sulfurtransferase